MGLALVVGLAVSPVSSAAVIAITGFAFGLIVAVAEGALAFRRLRRLKAGVATKQEKTCLRDPNGIQHLVKLLRPLQRSGMVIILIAVPILILDPSARPSAQSVTLVAALAAVAGIIAGLAIRSSVLHDRRLKFFHDLRPRLSRRLLPKPPDDDRSRSS